MLITLIHVPPQPATNSNRNKVHGITTFVSQFQRVTVMRGLGLMQGTSSPRIDEESSQTPKSVQLPGTKQVMEKSIISRPWQLELLSHSSQDC